MFLGKAIFKIASASAISVLALTACCVPAGAWATMTLPQMKALKGAAQMEMTLDSLFRICGLPAAIVDNAAANRAKLPIHWNRVAMHLTSMDWDVSYGMRERDLETSAGWLNPGEPAGRCTDGLSRLQLHAMGNAGVLTVTKKAQGIGYVTVYREPNNLFKAHKVVMATATLARSLPIEDILGRYGDADEVVRQPGKCDRLRYWVLTRRDHRPELLYAVDFEIDGRGTGTYTLTSSAVDFVRQRLDFLLQQWERDYVLD
ncbi:MAG: hypothetical protein WCV99_17535 [Sterolibacterium sp.]|jgi:hypothetical protein